MQVKRGAIYGAQWYQNAFGIAPRALTFQSIRLR